MTTAQRPMNGGEWALLLFLSLLWGGSFFFVGVAVKALPPFTIVAARVSIAAALLWSTARLNGLSPRAVVAEAPALALLGLVNNAIPFALIVYGQTRLASGLAAILNAATPIFTVAFAHSFRYQNGAADLAQVIGRRARACGRRRDDGRRLSSSAGACLGGTGSARRSGHLRLRQYLRPTLPRARLAPIDVATGQATAATLYLLPLALFVDRPWTLPAPGFAPIAALLALGALSTALAYVVYFRILAGAGATNVVLVTLLAPVTSILLGAFVLGERLGPRHFLGLALIAVGLVLIDGRIAKSAGRLGGVTS